jgi:Asp-tRNA(Asn)/Glu-tRNA(Gln) amidotransferase C subunit
MNLNKAIQRSHIRLDEDEQKQIENELSDVLNKLNHLKVFDPSRDTAGYDISLRDDTPRENRYESTSIHTDNDDIISPAP